MRCWFVPVLLVFMLACVSCSTKIPPEVTDRVSWRGDFKTLQSDPDAYVDEFVILGGEIINTDNFRDHSEMTILEFPLDNANRPRTDKNSGGRFLVRSDSFIDPEVYEPETLVTVAGRMSGAKERPIGDYEYNHPVIELENIWVWEPKKDGSPRFQFGLGIGKTF